MRLAFAPLVVGAAAAAAARGGCYGFPETDFSPSNYVQSWDMLGVQTGDAAPDFALADVDGADVSLSDMLRRGPVFLEAGSYT